MWLCAKLNLLDFCNFKEPTMANPSHDKGSAELLPCAHCGAQAMLDEHPAHSHSPALQALVPGIPDHPGSWTIECPTSGCVGLIGETRAEVVASWNRRATPPSPSTAPELDERAAFEAWAGPKQLSLRRTTSAGHGLYVEQYTRDAWDAWQGRAALASRPAEVDDEGLPEVLFDGNAVYAEITRKIGKAHCHNHETVSATLDAVVRLMRQGQRDAVAADRARVGRAMGLLREARVALETWKDVAPAVSLCADIDKVLAGDEQ